MNLRSVVTRASLVVILAGTLSAQIVYQAEAASAFTLDVRETGFPRQIEAVGGGPLALPFYRAVDFPGAAGRALGSLALVDGGLDVTGFAAGGPRSAVTISPMNLRIDAAIRSRVPVIVTVEADRTNRGVPPNSLSVDLGDDGIVEIDRSVAATSSDRLSVTLPATTTGFAIRIRHQCSIPSALPGATQSVRQTHAVVRIRMVPAHCVVTPMPNPGCTSRLFGVAPVPRFDGSVDFPSRSQSVAGATVAQILVLGFAQNPVPIPGASGCGLLPSPDIIIPFARFPGFGSTITLAPFSPLSNPLTALTQTLAFDSASATFSISDAHTLELR